jgi:hypothetical protein
LRSDCMVCGCYIEIYNIFIHSRRKGFSFLQRNKNSLIRELDDKLPLQVVIQVHMGKMSKRAPTDTLSSTCYVSEYQSYYIYMGLTWEMVVHHLLLHSATNALFTYIQQRWVVLWYCPHVLCITNRYHKLYLCNPNL